MSVLEYLLNSRLAESNNIAETFVTDCLLYLDLNQCTAEQLTAHDG